MQPNPQVEFVLIMVAGVGLIRAEAIEHEGQLWIVAEWLYSPDGKRRRPARSIRVDPFPYSVNPALGVVRLVNHSIPKAVLDGQSRQGTGFEYEVDHSTEQSRFGWWDVPTVH